MLHCLSCQHLPSPGQLNLTVASFMIFRLYTFFLSLRTSCYHDKENLDCDIFFFIMFTFPDKSFHKLQTPNFSHRRHGTIHTKTSEFLSARQPEALNVQFECHCVQISHKKILPKMNSSQIHLEDTKYWLLYLNKEYLSTFLFMAIKLAILIPSDLFRRTCNRLIMSTFD